MAGNSLGEEHAQQVAAFSAAADWFVRTAAASTGRLDDPGLGEWSVRDLIGHTSRALLTVESYLSAEPLAVDLTTAADYFAAAAARVDPAEVAERGRAAGAALGADPAAAVAGIAARATTLVADADSTSRCTTPVGVMTLAEYLPSRTLELTVHTCDLAAALDLPLEVPPVAAEAATRVVAQLAVRGGSAGSVLLALTGRHQLPTGFSVL